MTSIKIHVSFEFNDAVRQCKQTPTIFMDN